MRASDRPRTLYAGTGTLNELVGVAVRASLAFARVSGGMGASPRHPTVHDAFMQACGLVNDHTARCFRYAELTANR